MWFYTESRESRQPLRVCAAAEKTRRFISYMGEGATKTTLSFALLAHFVVLKAKNEESRISSLRRPRRLGQAGWRASARPPRFLQLPRRRAAGGNGALSVDNVPPISIRVLANANDVRLEIRRECPSERSGNTSRQGAEKLECFQAGHYAPITPCLLVLARPDCLTRKRREGRGSKQMDLKIETPPARQRNRRRGP